MTGNDARAPELLTVKETAALLRTSQQAVYVMVNRRTIGGVTRLGRRLLFRRRDLLDWLDRKRVPLAEE